MDALVTTKKDAALLAAKRGYASLAAWAKDNRKWRRHWDCKSASRTRQERAEFAALLDHDYAQYIEPFLNR